MSVYSKKENGPCHIVQVGYDTSAFNTQRASDYVERQIEYGRVLLDSCPGSTITNICLGAAAGAMEHSQEGVTFLPVTGGRFWQRIKLWKELCSILQKKSVAILTAQALGLDSLLLLVFGRLSRTPVVLQIHTDIFCGGSAGLVNFMQRLFSKFNLLQLSRFSGIRVVGNDLLRAVQEQGVVRKVELIPVPTLLAAGKPVGNHLEPKRVLFVGRLVPVKNLLGWLRVAQQIHARDSTIVFDIVGDGPLRPALEKLAEELGIGANVFFHGLTSPKELASYYSRASVFLLTSHSEGFGRVVVEAGRFGLPVVSTDVTGVRDMIRTNETGLLNESGDISGLADSVFRLLQDGELRQSLGSALRALVVERYAPAQLAQKWIKFLLSCASAERRNVEHYRGWMAAPFKPSWARWSNIAFSRHSVLRAMEYEALGTLSLVGRSLDVGGGRKADYLPCLKVKGTLESVNLDPSMEPTALANLNESLPFDQAAYDNIISLNTLEHVFKDEVALSEIFRILRPGGSFHLMVPFIFWIHGSPSDFHRHTPYWWADILVALGADPSQLEITPFYWSPLVSAYTLLERRSMRMILRMILRPLVMLPALFFRRGLLIPVDDESSAPCLPLGFYLKGVKKYAS